MSHSSSRGVKQNGEKKLMCQLEQNPQEAGVCHRGSRGGGGKQFTFSKVQHLTLLYLFGPGTDLDLPLYGSPLNPIAISFHDYTIIFSLSNGIKVLEPLNRYSFFTPSSIQKRISLEKKIAKKRFVNKKRVSGKK